jgi:hypothetical protein
MGIFVSPDVVSDGLIFCFDSANNNCFKGEPTVNLAAGGGLLGLSNITLTFLGLDGPWKKYSMSGTFTGGTYPFIMRITAVSFTANILYSSRCIIKTNVLNKFNYFGTNNAIAYVNGTLSSQGVSTIISNPDDGSITLVREGFAYTTTTVQTGYLWTNPINNTTFNSSTDFVWIREVQVEQKPYSTFFVDGTRGNTVATEGGLFDLSNNSNHSQIIRSASPLSNFYTSSNKGVMVFDGSNDYLSTSSLLQNKPFTISFWAKISSTKNQCFYCSRTVIGRGISIFGLGTQQNQIRFDTGLNQWSTGYNIPLDTWVNITLLVSNTNKTLFVNGEFYSTTSFNSSIVDISSSIATIGASQIDGSTYDNFLNGSMSNYCIYNKALTAQEIKQNYNNLKGRYI